MRRGVWLLLLGVVAAAFGAGSARADGTGTTTTTTTTTSYTRLPPSSLPRGCVGAGTAALVLPAHPVVAIGSPASHLGPSSYAPPAGAIVSFQSSASSGSTCASARVTLGSLSLFDGAVSATAVRAKNGKGRVFGLEIDGAPVKVRAGKSAAVGGWGRLTLGATVGRVTAPLVLRLLRAHDSLPAGSAVAVAFAAAAQPKPAPPQRVARPAHAAKHAAAAKEHKPRGPRRSHYWAHYKFRRHGGLSRAARKDAAVTLARRYLGIRYKWAGARPRTGFDCSGLVQYVYAKLGVWLPHNAAALWHSSDTRWVRPDHLEPGDLVFFKSDGTHKRPGHVGIYIGRGYLIDAPHTGAFVRVDSFRERWYARQFVGGKRVLGVSPGRGAPRVLAAVAGHRRHSVRHALARRLLAVAKVKAAAARLRSPLAPISLGSAVARVAVVRVAARTAAAPDWLEIGLGGSLLLLLAGAVSARGRLPRFRRS